MKPVLVLLALMMIFPLFPVRAEPDARNVLAAAKLQAEANEKVKKCDKTSVKTATAAQDKAEAELLRIRRGRFSDGQVSKAFDTWFDASQNLKKEKAKLETCTKVAEKAKAKIKALIGTETVGSEVVKLRKELNDLEPACSEKRCRWGKLDNLIKGLTAVADGKEDSTAAKARKKHRNAVDYSEEWAKLDPQGDKSRIIDIYWLDYKDNKGELAETVVWGRDMPEELRCTKADVRIWHFCVEPRFFDPSARVFFEKGSSDSPGEADIYDDGSLSGSIELVGAYLPFRFGHGRFSDKWSWGPVASIGIARGEDDDDETADDGMDTGGDDIPPVEMVDGETSDQDRSNDSDAPSVIATLGLMLEYRTKENIRFGVEGGYAWGWSADEMFEDRSDKARYVGLRLDIPLPGKQ